ncbi:hypothetical protein EK904_002688 [Melospiza melodia maxima]|nr:hypothetical protein EK904_002688 [Melospiza melodia maxima]
MLFLKGDGLVSRAGARTGRWGRARHLLAAGARCRGCPGKKRESLSLASSREEETAPKRLLSHWDDFFGKHGLADQLPSGVCALSSALLSCDMELLRATPEPVGCDPRTQTLPSPVLAEGRAE